MINKVVIVGRITKDAEVKKTQSGISSCRFCLAVDKKEGADFIDCQAWRQSADYMGYCKKGDIVGVDGHLKTYTYERDRSKIKVVEVEADRVRRIYGKKIELDSETELPSETAQNDSWGDDDLGKELPF